MSCTNCFKYGEKGLCVKLPAPAKQRLFNQTPWPTNVDGELAPSGQDNCALAYKKVLKENALMHRKLSWMKLVWTQLTSSVGYFTCSYGLLLIPIRLANNFSTMVNQTPSPVSLPNRHMVLKTIE